LLAAVSYQWSFRQITHYANPDLEKALASAPVTVTANPADCNFLFDPVGGKVFKASCDVARQTLIGLSVNYQIVNDPAASPAVVKIGERRSRHLMVTRLMPRPSVIRRRRLQKQ